MQFTEEQMKDLQRLKFLLEMVTTGRKELTDELKSEMKELLDKV